MSQKEFKFKKRNLHLEVASYSNNHRLYVGCYNTINELFNDIKNKYEIIYKDLNIEKNNKYYLILIYLLVISLCLNFINVMLLIYYIK